MFAREASGARTRIRSAGFPAHKTLEDFDLTAQPSAERPLVMHLAQLAWIEEHANVCLIGPPGTGKSHLAIALGIKACEHGYRVAFATAQQWVSRLEEAQDRNTLEQELRRLERYQLLIVDEVGYLPLERQAANLLFALVSRRYERGIDHHHLKPRVRSLGRDPRRRDGRRRPDRPTRPPRHHGHPQRQELPPPRTRQRPRLRRPTQRRSKTDPPPTARRRHLTPLAYGSLREKPPRPSTGLASDRRVVHFSVPETGALFGSC